MSTFRTVHLICDDCGQVEYDGFGHSASEVRGMAYRDGWERLARRDICPECWAERGTRSSATDPGSTR